MKMIEQLARECGAEYYYGTAIYFTPRELEAFRKAVIREYFESAEPVVYLFADRTVMMADVPGAKKVATKLNSKRLFAAPKEE